MRDICVIAFRCLSKCETGIIARGWWVRPLTPRESLWKTCRNQTDHSFLSSTSYKCLLHVLPFYLQNGCCVTCIQHADSWLDAILCFSRETTEKPNRSTGSVLLHKNVQNKQGNNCRLRCFKNPFSFILFSHISKVWFILSFLYFSASTWLWIIASLTNLTIFIMQYEEICGDYALHSNHLLYINVQILCKRKLQPLCIDVKDRC